MDQSACKRGKLIKCLYTDIAAQGHLTGPSLVSLLAFFRLDSDNISPKLAEKSQIFQTCSVCKSHYVVFSLLLWMSLSKLGEAGSMFLI